MAAVRRVAVFGGAGFLGRRIVGRLREVGFAVRIASRHLDRARSLISGCDAEIVSVRADVNDDRSVAAAVVDCFAVVNAVSLYVERGGDTFRRVHVDAAARVARRSATAGVERLVHISGIGADAGSPSAYIRSRGKGEAAVLQEFPATTLVRPAVMFGPDDTLLVPLLSLLRRLPVFPLFGRGGTRLQPAYVEDVGEAVARIVRLPAAEPVYELAGPRVYDYRSLLRLLGDSIGSHALLLPVTLSTLGGHRRGRRNAADPADHAKPGGADAARQHRLARHAWLCRPADRAALARRRAGRSSTADRGREPGQAAPSPPPR